MRWYQQYPLSSVGFVNESSFNEFSERESDQSTKETKNKGFAIRLGSRISQIMLQKTQHVFNETNGHILHVVLHSAQSTNFTWRKHTGLLTESIQVVHRRWKFRWTVRIEQNWLYICEHSAFLKMGKHLPTQSIWFINVCQRINNLHINPAN